MQRKTTISLLLMRQNVCRHHDNEERLGLENKELAKQLRSCQKDLHDINEFLLNELKVILIFLQTRGSAFRVSMILLMNVNKLKR